MGRRYDDSWNYYSHSTPRRVQGGIKTKRERGNIGETWWSRRWIAALERLGMGSRLTRGRTYARQGQVLSIDVQPGCIKAKVQGSMRQPYSIEIQLLPLSDAEWERVMDAMAEQALFAAKLLAGEMPPTIEDAFSAVDLSLFPAAMGDLRTKCSCPDWANPCKHIAAVYYILAERFDDEPFLLFQLRGRSKEQVIEALRARRVAATPEPLVVQEDHEESVEGPEDAVRLESYVTTFWEAGGELETFTLHLQRPDVEKAVLKRLGPAPYTIGKQTLSDILSRAYDVAQEATARKVQGDID